jgi:hypothetical protein
MKVNKNNPINSVLIIVLVLLILFHYFGDSKLIYAAILVGVLGLLSSTIANWIDTVWINSMKAVGYLNTHLLLGLIFFLILTPLSFIYRLFTKDIMHKTNNNSSMFHQRNHMYEMDDLKNPW